MKEKEIVNYWINEILTGLNLFPSVKFSFENGLLDVSMCVFLEEEKRTHYLLDSLEKVLLHSDVNYSSLIIFPRVLDDFQEFCEWGNFLDELIKKQNLPENIQLIIFHPSAHLVNSSPYPTIYLFKDRAMEGSPSIMSLQHEEILKSISLNRLKELFFWKKDLS